MRDGDFEGELVVHNLIFSWKRKRREIEGFCCVYVSVLEIVNYH